MKNLGDFLDYKTEIANGERLLTVGCIVGLWTVNILTIKKLKQVTAEKDAVQLHKSILELQNFVLKKKLNHKTKTEKGNE